MSKQFTCEHALIGNGFYSLPVAGVSFYRGNIAMVADNPDGLPALMFCKAFLVPDDDNPHDANAILVVIESKKVGHLPASLCEAYRKSLVAQAGQVPVALVDAVVSGGLYKDGKAYEYSIGLDAADGFRLRDLNDSDELSKQSEHGYKPLTQVSADVYMAEVWLPVSDIGELHKKLRVQQWTGEHWDTVAFFVLNAQGLGLGFKVYEMPKALHAEVFGPGALEMRLQVMQGRRAALYISARSQKP